MTIKDSFNLKNDCSRKKLIIRIAEHKERQELKKKRQLKNIDPCQSQKSLIRTRQLLTFD